MSGEYSEDALVEQPAIEIFGGLGWQTIGAFDEVFGAGGTLGREHAGEVVLLRHLVPALKKLNPKAPAEAIDAAVNELTRDRSVMSLAAAIRAGKVERLIVYKLDRLGRSLTHLALILDELNRLKVPLIASSQGIDTSDDNPAGRLQLGVLMAVAEFERGIIKERVNAGLAAARQRGVQLGRPSTINGRAVEIRKLKAKGLGLRAIARQLKMPPSSVHKALQLAA